MASPVNALVCALIATAFWSLAWLRARQPACSARPCDRCRPGDRLVGAQRRDPADLFVIWIFAFSGGRYRRGLRSDRRFFVVAAALGG